MQREFPLPAREDADFGKVIGVVMKEFRCGYLSLYPCIEYKKEEQDDQVMNEDIVVVLPEDGNDEDKLSQAS